MTELTDFLLARIAEDEAAAGRALRDVIGEGGTVHAKWWAAGDAVLADAPGQYVYVVEQHRDVGDTAVAEYVARWDPARVLAECEAKRAIVERAQFVADHGPAVDHVRALDMSIGAAAALRDALQFLALPYADHPDYDEAWRP